MASFGQNQPITPNPWFKNRKIWAGIGIFALILGMGVWYFFYNRDLQECKALLSFLEKKKVLIQIIQKIERQEIKLLPQEGDTLLFRKADSSLLKIYFERCVNEKTTLGKLVRLKTNEEYVMDIRIEAFEDFKTLTVTEHAEGKETIAHYFELDSDFRVAVYEDIEM